MSMIDEAGVLDTDGNEMYSACLLDSGQPGIACPIDAYNRIRFLILGCSNGFIVKFE